MLTFINDYFRKVWILFLKQKTDIFTTFKQWKAMIEKQIERQIKCLCTDNDLKFCSNKFNDFCRKEEILRDLIVPSNPYASKKWCSQKDEQNLDRKGTMYAI